MGWAWLILLLATYPWLLGADLASDTLARTHFIAFISGATLLAPARRLPRWQVILFAAGVGFLFEARRAIPDGTVALTLIAITIFLTAHKRLLRTAPGLLRAAALSNLIAALTWALASALSAGEWRESGLLDPLLHALAQAALAGGLGFLIFVPVALTQNAVLDRLGVPPFDETK